MRVELIAEVASNHGGDLALAKEFIHRFAEAGADWVKFQTTRVKHLRPDDPQYAWFQQAELSDDAHFELKAECEKAGTKFLTTVYNAEEIPFVRSLCDVVKIGSGEACEDTFVEKVKHAGFSRVIISDGISRPIGFAHDLLACVTRYPAPHGCVPMRFGSFETHIGWSDHCIGLDSCKVAILRGARIIEKHVRLAGQRRYAQSWEADFDEFKELRAFTDENPQRFIGRWQCA